jgi:D-alanyl-D-alanine carboxypeptidase-like protein
MSTAQNGWPVIPNTDAGRSKLVALVLPGGAMPHTVRVLAGDVATIARWHVREYHRRVEPIEPAGCWGWNVRKIGDGPDWSNHAAACAWDLNAPDNPDGVPPTRVMTSAQIEQCHALERESNGVLRWGGDWSDPDPMHWEIVGTRAQAAVLAKRIRNQEEEMSDVTGFTPAARAVIQQEVTEGSVAYKGRGLPTWEGQPKDRNLLNAFTQMFETIEAMAAELKDVHAKVTLLADPPPPPPA